MSQPLPFPPPFPVYGVAAASGWPRWLHLWNQVRGIGRGPLWQVSLGHGHQDDGPCVIVITDAKLPKHEPDDHDPLRYGPTGLVDVALSALTCLNRYANAPAADLRTTGNQADRIMDLAERVREPKWSALDLVVGDTPRAFWVRAAGPAWAAVADLDEVAVGLCAYRVDSAELALEAVNGRLSEYLSVTPPWTGTGESPGRGNRYRRQVRGAQAPGS